MRSSRLWMRVANKLCSVAQKLRQPVPLAVRRCCDLPTCFPPRTRFYSSSPQTQLTAQPLAQRPPIFYHHFRSKLLSPPPRCSNPTHTQPATSHIILQHPHDVQSESRVRGSGRHQERAFFGTGKEEAGTGDKTKVRSPPQRPYLCHL